MHMADALLSPSVGITMYAGSVVAIGYAVKRITPETLGEKKMPLMAVMGAFVFATQMINFTIPGTGSSGHIGGGILLAATLGAYPALLVMASVLTIQCLFFADGGLLALGANIFNLGVIPCLFVYPLVFRTIVRKAQTQKRINTAAITSVIIALQLGALAVVLETTLSGVTELPFVYFLLAMQPIHLAIGIVEGFISAAIIWFIYTMRPQILEATLQSEKKDKVGANRILITLVIATLVVGGLLSLFASTHPDGLEWAIEKVAGTDELSAEGAIFESATAIIETTAIMPDYGFADVSQGAMLGTSVAGIIGGVLTFAAAFVVALAISAVKKKAKGNCCRE